MKYLTSSSIAPKIIADCLIIGVYNKNKLSKAADDINKSTNKLISRSIKSGDIRTELGQFKILTSGNYIKAKRLLIVGLGDKGSFGASEFKKANEVAINAILYNKLKSIANFLILEKVNQFSEYYKARFIIEAFFSCTYQFNKLKTQSSKYQLSPDKIILAKNNGEKLNNVRLGCKHAEAIGLGMEIARNLGNLPANICTPTYLAKESQKIAKKYKNLNTKILNESALKKLKMNSFLSVTAGSKEPAKLIVMQYKGAKSEKPFILVGKGITFDTGGISIKPSPAMDEMKFDMCGAASVIGTINAVAKMKLPINLTVIVPACENRPSSTATLPGDIIKSMSGQTIEILNTDAEGRLILCDALTYAERFKPKYIIDVATLTGACVIALGHHRTAIMSNNDELSNKIFNAGDRSMDQGWKMPMGSEYEAQLKSNFADIANIGGRYGGSITAACFLGKFTKKMKWAHLDIAGTAWKSGSEKGSTGRPVPMLTDFMINQSRLNTG